MQRTALVMFVFLAFGACSAAHAANLPLSCVSNAGVPPIIRAEGRSELTGDIVLICTGGSAGVQTTATFMVSMSAKVTSRLLLNGATAEPLLIVGEPYNSPQVVGGNVFSGSAGAQGENSIVFTNIPFTQPGENATLPIRLTNIRIDASTLPLSATPAPATAFALCRQRVPQPPRSRSITRHNQFVRRTNI